MGLDAERAAELVWALTSDDVHHLLRGVRAWSRTDYVETLSDLLARAILSDPEG